MLLNAIRKMGCFCGKESINIDDRRFVMKHRLGEGGFSYVDLVEDARTHKAYALKRIICHSKEEEEVAQQEIAIMQDIRHPNVIPLECYSIQKVGQYTKAVDIVSKVYLVLPLYRKGNLLNMIDICRARGESMDENKIWSLMLGICQGVKALHDHDPPFAHRDIKPDNVMTEPNGRPVLMDLGSAAPARVEIRSNREAVALQDLAAERCSMLYRSPELFNVESNSSIDERTDIWSLGCVLYALAFLEAPYQNAYQRGDSLALATMAGKMAFPSDTRYSKNLMDTITWMMKTNIQERPFIDQVIERIGPYVQQDINRRSLIRVARDLKQ